MKIKRLIYFIPLLLIGCKEAPKEYYSAGEVEVIEPIECTTNTSDSDTIPINTDGVSPEAIEFINELNKKYPLRHMINPEETAPHLVKVRIKE